MREDDYPMIMVNTLSNMIVEFTSQTTGKVLSPGAGFLFQAGDELKNLDISDYTSMRNYR